MSKLFERVSKSPGSQTVEPVNHFFKEHNINGYFTKPMFLDYISGFRSIKPTFKNVEDSFDFVRMKFEITNRLEVSTNPRTGDYIIWLRFKLANGTRRLPIPYDEGILRFFSEYQMNGLAFDADLELLLSEAGFTFNDLDL